MNYEQKRLKSLAMIISAMVIYGTIGIFRKSIPVSSEFLAFTRGLLGSLFIIVLARIKKIRLFHSIGFKKSLLLAISGAIIGFNWLCLFEAYNYTSVATATMCYYMAPTFVILLSPILFSEKLTSKKLLCALFSVIGMVFVSGITKSGMPSSGEIKGIIYGLLSALLYATVIIMNKKLANINSYEKTAIQLLSSSIVLLPFVYKSGAVSEVSFDYKTCILIFTVGFVHTGLAYLLYFGSVDNLSSQTVAILSYIDPVTALILSVIVLSEKISVLSAAGAVLIIGAAVISETKERKNNTLHNQKPRA